jgi:hypothetical protein
MMLVAMNAPSRSRASRSAREGSGAVGLDLSPHHEVGQDAIGVAHGAERGKARNDERAHADLDVEDERLHRNPRRRDPRHERS